MKYDQPFYVGNNPRFPTARDGWLPALELPDKPQKETKDVESEWDRRQWDIIRQLRADQINLRKTLYNTLKEIKQLIAKRKPRTTKNLGSIYNPGCGGDGVGRGGD